jgi:hypothetical protein
MDEYQTTLTPEKALWCAVFITFFEDMNQCLEQREKVKKSDKERWDLKNAGMDTSIVVSKKQYLSMLNTKMRRLIFVARHQYIKDTFEILGLDHSSFYSRLVWQYRLEEQIKLNWYQLEDQTWKQKT